MSRLLFAVASHVDGRCSLDQIAAEVSEEFGRRLLPDDAAFLVDAKLRPAGIVVNAGSPAPELRRSDPFLGLRIRARVVPQATVGRAARVAAPLFNPYVVGTLLALVAAIDLWLYFLHGLAQGVRQVVLQPHLTLVVLGLLIVSTALHELGHAAACRYGGARPGAIGVGLYLAWPVFYSDVTDSYRLDRNGRLRTDLGGVYFNLVFTVLLVVAYGATRFEPLLVVVALVQVEALHQFFPFFRLDGYYVVSDLIGVPDLFARMRPALASLLPHRPLDPEVAGLKSWARYAVVGWVLTTLAVIAALYALLLAGLPRLLATALQSSQAQAAAIRTGWVRADIVLVALGAVEELLLLLPLVALALTLARVARHLAIVWWRAGERQPLLRYATVGAICLALGLAAGTLGAPAHYEPIRPTEKGTLPAPAQVSETVVIHEVVPVPLLRYVPSPVAQPAASPTAAQTAPAPTASPTPAASASAGPSPAASPTASPAPSSSPAASPVPSASP